MTEVELPLDDDIVKNRKARETLQSIMGEEVPTYFADRNTS